MNVTYQRDIGFNTTAEVAYVGAFTNAAGRLLDINRPTPCICSGTRTICSTATRWTPTSRTAYPGMGQINRWIDQKKGDNVNARTLQYARCRRASSSA